MEKTIEQLKVIIAQRLDANIAYEEITLDAPLLEDGLGLDSIMIVELVALVEDTFGFHFGEDDLDLANFADVKTLAAFVTAKQSLALASEKNGVNSG